MSEATRLKGENHRPLQRHIDSGKLPKVTAPAISVKTVDKYELSRVYGKLNVAYNHTQNHN